MRLALASRVPGAVSAFTRVFDALWHRASFTRGALQTRDPGANREILSVGPWVPALRSRTKCALAWPGHESETRSCG
jgi:hypothetical protein